MIVPCAGWSGGQGWLQATAAGGAQRPWRLRGRREADDRTFRRAGDDMVWGPGLGRDVVMRGTPHQLVSGRVWWPVPWSSIHGV